MTVPLEADPLKSARDPRARDSTPPRWPWWLLRVGVTAQAIAAFLQPVLAGRFLSGDYPMLGVHRTNATVVGVLAIGQIVTALLAWRVGRAPGRLVVAVVGLAVATALEIGLGYARVLGIHTPLGVAIVAVSAWLLVWAWRSRPTDPAS